MLFIKKCIFWLFFAILSVFSLPIFAVNNINVPILCYHNFNPTKPGSMNLTPQRFEQQMKWLKDNDFTFIRLSEAVEYLQGKRDSLPSKAIVVTADDGWQSVYTYLVPIAKKYDIPVTLFIYPGTISEGKNAMTWEELKELQQTGLFDIQSHTYSHPNFKIDKRTHSPETYEKIVKNELIKSKQILEEKMGTKITLLAWPFGIYNDYLEKQAADAGYEMAFTIDALPANRNFKPMAQPRYMIVAGLTERTFVSIANQANSKAKIINAKNN